MPLSSKYLSWSGRRILCCYPSCQSWVWVFFKTNKQTKHMKHKCSRFLWRGNYGFFLIGTAQIYFHYLAGFFASIRESTHIDVFWWFPKDASFYFLLRLSPGCLESNSCMVWYHLLSFRILSSSSYYAFRRSCHCKNVGVLSAENSALYNWSESRLLTNIMNKLKNKTKPKHQNPPLKKKKKRIAFSFQIP